MTFHLTLDTGRQRPARKIQDGGRVDFAALEAARLVVGGSADGRED